MPDGVSICPGSSASRGAVRRIDGCERGQGWLDITYLSPDGRFRLSRGNKGTLFVLVRDDPPAERLLAAIARGASDAQARARSPRGQQRMSPYCYNSSPHYRHEPGAHVAGSPAIACRSYG